MSGLKTDEIVPNKVSAIGSASGLPAVIQLSWADRESAAFLLRRTHRYDNTMTTQSIGKLASSAPHAGPTGGNVARRRLINGEWYWLATTRADSQAGVK